ncbi:MAG: alanine--tRNA ligase, partial [Bacteroidetes bacterium]|nr:alanine--tRNA ligase [Bacteroidota bacterium]
FLDFFKSKQHQIVASAPIVVKNDPTLMFINSGMAPFKDYFLGIQQPKFTRIADTQKCLRVSGKHNDLEEVGVDTYHHTMFEMLGNWSFGDYFKKEAIAWSWEFLTEVLKLEKDRLYVTIFEGNEAENIPKDEEAYNEWKKVIAEDRILLGNKKDNFWEMGDTGPCGPCTEIHVDCRSDEERNQTDGATLVNNDHPQVIEIWNNVFIEFERKADGSLVKLSKQHVDTGMGFERLVRVLQNKTSNYDTDIFMPLIEKLEEISGKTYGKNERTDIAFRVIADHIRAISFTIADGQLPASNGAGYVIRRILRRAVRYGYTYLGFNKAFLAQLLPVLVAQFKDVFPEIKLQEKFIEKVITEEENSFFKTLSTGLKLIDDIEKELHKKGKTIIDGTKAFELYDTYGFPLDLTELVAKEKGLSVDIKGFEKAMQEQKNRSRNAEQSEQSDWTVLAESDLTNFEGYTTLECPVKITKYRKVEKKGKTQYHLVFDKTPFYAESGGQVGDTGYIENNGEKTYVIDTQKENQLFIHIVNELPKNINATFNASVNKEKRNKTAMNHSATHLLHKALRDTLGTHVEQRGSLVNDEYLRFDFSHFQKVTDEELNKIEELVNQEIEKSIPLQSYADTPIEKAKEMGAMALFGEKYGDKVRVVKFGNSIELCGGTHVENTGNIKYFKIINENSIAAGIRRIEALTGNKVIAYYKEQEDALNQIKTLLNNPPKTVDAVVKLQEENEQLKKQLEALQLQQQGNIKEELLKKVSTENGLNIIAEKIDAPNADSIKNLAFQLKNEVENLFLVLGSIINDKPLLTVMISDNIVKERNLNAGTIIREIAKEIQGGGGGQPFYATAGGKKVEGIDSAIAKAKSFTL